MSCGEPISLGLAIVASGGALSCQLETLHNVSSRSTREIERSYRFVRVHEPNRQRHRVRGNRPFIAGGVAVDILALTNGTSALADKSSSKVESALRVCLDLAAQIAVRTVELDVGGRLGNRQHRVFSAPLAGQHE